MAELGPAIMLNSIKSSLDINKNNAGGETTNISKALSQTWGDFLLVARIANKPGQKFIYQLRGDIGGGFSGTNNAVFGKCRHMQATGFQNYFSLPVVTG